MGGWPKCVPGVSHTCSTHAASWFAGIASLCLWCDCFHSCSLRQTAWRLVFAVRSPGSPSYDCRVLPPDYPTPLRRLSLQDISITITLAGTPWAGPG